MTNSNQKEAIFVESKNINGFEYQILKLKNDISGNYVYIVSRIINKNIEDIEQFDDVETAKKCLDNLGQLVKIQRKGDLRVYVGKVVFWTDKNSGRVEIIGKQEGTDDKDTQIIFDKFDDKGNSLIDVYKFIG
ncbi:hypothetical protein KAU19_06190 [Candidatus Parcubacteria bacterium]|nr:hypothetical protein [Candidatus Parcubacteria bacterium]